MYRTLKEKKHVFNQNTINSREELQYMIKTLGSRSCLRFRGVCESKYCMLTSLQRNCPIPMKGQQKQYISLLLEEIKNNPGIVLYFQNKGIAINDISCLSLMQHFGLPTPLLDFTTDISVALSFASKGICMSSGNEETDEYVSLYVFDKVSECEVGTPLQQIYMDGMVTGIQRWQNHIKQHPEQPIDASILFSLNEFVRWNDIRDLELVYVEYQPLSPGVITLSGQSLSLSNPNLDKQKGCFILNLFDETTPLEKNWNMRLPESRAQFWKNKESVMQSLPFSGVTTKEKMACFDIRKEIMNEWAADNAVVLYDNTEDSQSIKDLLDKIQLTLIDKINK